MNRPLRTAMSLTLCALTIVSGCTPRQPFFFHEDGDLSHYTNVATDIEYPDAKTAPLPEVEQAKAPLTLANAEDFKIWDLTLEEATRITLQNSQVFRSLGGRVSDQGQDIANTTPVAITSNGTNTATAYDPALVESGYGGNTGSVFTGNGVEAALSEFDAQLDSSIFWAKNDRPQNFGLASAPGFFAPQFSEDTGQFTAAIIKTAADGTQFEIRNNTNYDQNNNGSRTTPSDWTTNIEAAVTRPLLQGAGTQYNRIAGPRSFQEYSSGQPDNIDGVLIARVRYDISLTDFEGGVNNMMRDVEEAYWELYFSYRDLEARKIGRDSALETWRKVKALERVSGEGGEADKEAQARSQYYLFRAQVETALTTIFRVENRLRYLMGISVSDGKLIRPIDEPSTAQVHFDWPTIHAEALTRRVELRKQKWQIEKRELELIAARNGMLPRLDAVGRYRWLGAGDTLIDSQRTGIQPFADGSNAFENLTSGRYQEWQLGLELNVPIGFRRALTEVRNHELLLANERAILKDMELEVSHQLGDAVRDVDLNYGVAQTNLNRRSAAQDEVDAVSATYEVGRVTLDLLLQAQQRRADAETAYYRSLADYNRAIMRLHYWKGSLLEYNGVYLAEGPWPGKAYFDALRRARQRDASIYLDYGFTRPSVISRGPVGQFSGTPTGGAYQGPAPEPSPDQIKDGNSPSGAPGQGAPQGEVIPLPGPGTPVGYSPIGASTMAAGASPLPTMPTGAAGAIVAGSPPSGSLVPVSASASAVGPPNPFAHSSSGPTSAGFVPPDRPGAATNVADLIGAATPAPGMPPVSAAYESEPHHPTLEAAPATSSGERR